MPRIDHEDILTRYLAGAHVDVGPAMRSLPAGIEPGLVASAVVQVMERAYWLGRHCKVLPAPVIREVLRREVAGATHLFLRLAVPAAELTDPELEQAWQAALQALLDLETTYAWGSRQRRAKIAGLAASVMLPAIQGTVAHAEVAPLDMLAVLVADGSAASYDALVAHIDAAFASGDRRLDILARLQTHAVSTPELDRLFSELDVALGARNDASPALALGPVMGIGEIDMLHFGVRLSSTRQTQGRVPWIQGSVHIDSRETEWFHVWVSTVDDAHMSSSFSVAREPKDQLGIGRCAPAELPRWLVETAAKLEIEWEPFTVTHSNLRGKKRDRVAQWLMGRATR